MKIFQEVEMKTKLLIVAFICMISITACGSFKGQIPEGEKVSVILELSPYLQNNESAKEYITKLSNTLLIYKDKIQVIDAYLNINFEQKYAGIRVIVIKAKSNYYYGVEESRDVYDNDNVINYEIPGTNPSYKLKIISPYHINEKILYEDIQDLLHFLRLNTKVKVNQKNNFNNKGIAFVDSGKYEKAIEYFEKAIEINPDDHEAWYNKGEAILGFIKSDSVYNNSYNYTIERDGKKFFLGDYYTQIRMAMQCYNEAINIKPDYYEAWHGRGCCHCELEEYKNAIDCYDVAIKINSSYPLSWYSNGYDLNALQEYEDAIV